MSSDGSSSISTSPIKLFGQAKVRITQVFDEIKRYAVDSESLLCAEDQFQSIATAQQTSLVKNSCTRVCGILEVLERNCMKVAFFGRTSNGKSTVVNAMLKSKILPSGIGHTTNCFVQVEGTDQKDAFIITEDAPDVHQSIQSISHLAHALSKVRLDPDSLVRICWPKEQCHLLKEDVIFVDSPGVDVTPDLDRWIDKFCLDADVFVLVVNAESTLMQTEKNFFHHVASRLSKPNIFILNNRWDASANEPDTIEEVKQQHLERAVSFLCDELSVMEPRDAEERVFFVSARETLDCSLSGVRRARQDGWESRLAEFDKFQHKFGECISKSALNTKFSHHVTSGLVLVGELKKLWDDLHSEGIAKRASCLQACDELQGNLEYIDNQQRTLMFEMEDAIEHAVYDVHQKLFIALADEIKRLSRILEEFDRPFNTELSELVVYKKELCFHVEECLSRNLHVRCYGFIQNVLHNTTQQLQESVSSFLVAANPSNAVVVDKYQRNDFEMAYNLDCAGLLSDFQEDIEFRFSLGFTSLSRRFLQARMSSKQNGAEISSAHNFDHSTDSLIFMLNLSTSLYSGTAIGSLAIVAIVTKSVGWKVIGACSAAYAALYVYERVTWTAKAKEATFQRQFINYASSQLGIVIDLATENCSSQVKRELMSVYQLVGHQVNATRGDMQDRLESLRTDICRFNQLVSLADKMRSKAERLASVLNKLCKVLNIHQ